VQRCVSCILVLAVIFCINRQALADDVTGKAGRQPVGVFSDDNGQRILVGLGTTAPLATLDVSLGEVKIGSTGTQCKKELGGTLRYTNSKLQLCDGASWRNVSLDKAE
jgi:hypothetical protein